MAETFIKNKIFSYKLLFTLSWLLFYLVFPTWALPVSVTARASVFFGLMVLFFIADYMMDRWFHALPVFKSAIILPKESAAFIKNNLGLFFICFAAGILHIYYLFFPILMIGDEALHLQAGLWIYEHIDISWHRFFQIAFWTLIVMVLLFKTVKKKDLFYLNRPEYTSGIITKISSRSFFIFLILFFSVTYFLLLRNFTFSPGFIRYPHLVKLLYHTVYSAVGITHIGPRVLQLIFYLAGAVYLYRTIILFSNRESALIGATVYLFFPVVFSYAHLAEIGSGSVFFIMLISFHFLRFIKEEDNRDLLLTSFFISTGFMYKRDIFLMFFICTIYLIARGVKNRDSNLSIHLKVMLISLVSIIPWMIIGKFFSWRNYRIIWSNFIPFEGKVFSFFMHIPLDISWILFILFLFSTVFIMIFKRSTLSLFFGLLFVAYYFFLALDIASYSPRLAMSYYPAIAVYIALFLSSIIKTIKWKHSFRIIYSVLTVYLIIICAVPPVNAQFLSSLEYRKLQYYPGGKAMRWVKDNVQDREKILMLRIMPTLFYRDKFGIDKNKIVHLWYSLRDVSTPEMLRDFIIENRITYVMFPYSPEYPFSEHTPILQYLGENHNNEFIVTAKFNIGENVISIYKVK